MHKLCLCVKACPCPILNLSLNCDLLVLQLIIILENLPKLSLKLVFPPFLFNVIFILKVDELIPLEQAKLQLVEVLHLQVFHPNGQFKLQNFNFNFKNLLSSD